METHTRAILSIIASTLDVSSSGEKSELVPRIASALLDMGFFAGNVEIGPG